MLKQHLQGSGILVFAPKLLGINYKLKGQKFLSDKPDY